MRCPCSKLLVDGKCLQAVINFEAKFMPEPNTGCWIWFAGFSDTGYGSFRHRGIFNAHKFSYNRAHAKRA